MVRGHTPIDHSRLQVSRTAFVGQTASGTHARGWTEPAGVQRSHRAGATPPEATSGTWLQSGRRASGAPRTACCGRSASGAGHATAGYPGGRPSATQYPGSVRGGGRVSDALDRTVAPRQDGRPRGRRHDNRGDPRCMCEGATRRRGSSGARPHDCESLSSTAAAIASATSAFGRSPSIRSQPGCWT